MSPKLRSVLLRFVRVFVAAGLASIIPLLSPDAPISFRVLLIAFVSGGIIAAEKWLRWQDKEIPA